ncbi:uncharacterized protein LOC126745694 [Anthonomus grandis grandis]|uniref:uncharacterized protein LOC126745694 n=1 Tax=Anthonomus grandis grandis TaxID=2921223 RepID=UPI00216620BB|nr:uncharacterized protein LOC126745694 [Anthonomus grandis grandis]
MVKMEETPDFFHNSVCHKCKKLCDYPAKHCANCKIVAYCCRAHQIQDWKHHKTFCKLACRGHIQAQNNIKTHADLRLYIERMGFYLNLKLGRKLSKAETQMFMFPKLCAICFRQEAVSGCSCPSCVGRFSIFECERCRSEFYCSRAHQEKHQPFHKLWCDKLKLSLDLSLNQKISELSCLNVKKFELMPKELNSLSSIIDIPVDTNKLEFLNFADQVLSGLTLLATLGQTSLLKNHKIIKPSCKLHVVGAASFESTLNWATIVEIFFHWIHNLESLNINLIGPELDDSPNQFEDLKSFLCEECRDTRNIIGPIFHKNFYHELVNDLPKPDLVVAFNSGLHEFFNSGSDTWENSLTSLAKYVGVPLVFTAYTEEEIFKDLEVLKQAMDNIKIIHGPCQNQFRNVKPLRDWENQKVPIYYINNYVCAVMQI